jgi:DNA-binding response OmpR family regulator
MGPKMILSQPADSSNAPPPPILIVDDNELTAKSLARVLEAADYRTAIALRGGDGLEFARNNRCSAALVDVHLPDLNGLVVAQKMRDLLGPNIPIIVVSGDTSMEVINALSHVGATYFFSKPLNVPYLLDRIKALVNVDSTRQ